MVTPEDLDSFSAVLALMEQETAVAMGTASFSIQDSWEIHQWRRLVLVMRIGALKLQAFGGFLKQG